MNKEPFKNDYWFSLAAYDLDTAKAMFETKRWLYVGFMCHQAIEKSLKGIYVSVHKKIPPYTHNLTYLAEKASLYKGFSESQKDFIDQLEPLNLAARYPANPDKITELLDFEKCRVILSKTEELSTWIKTQLLG
jgi:HEPN domain-containing protein